MAKKKASILFEDSGLEALRKALALDRGKIKKSKEELVRKSFRVFCEKEDAAFVAIKGEKYPVVNISTRGLGIQLPNDAIFFRGEDLPEIIFSYRERKTTLQGSVVHVSLENENQYLCGISLSDMSKEQEKLFLGIVEQKRLAMFGRE